MRIPQSKAFLRPVFSLNNRGVSVIQLMVGSVLSIMGALVASQVFMTSIKVGQQASVTNELHLIRERVFKNVDCQASLATRMPPLPNDPNAGTALTQCVLDIGEPFKGPQLVMKDRNGGNLFSKLDATGEIGTEGAWDMRAGCFLRVVGGGNKQYCLFFQRRQTFVPNEANAGYVTDWHKLFEFPVCCDGT